ncbi:hypothetical protein K504DRAFT_450488 [Pleomassaria siparia CBS 279.74]|uniref:Uncharacterized protein n=1 Tax=Pleomassaria siparia CBS 279.74 TaxID=1314801 RepID=A0A6G1KLY7_9PLEO|nr:hypothetical protein K504DRAFT_450488 [Pleomassaria siparia CBS 279.74]
MGGCLGYCSLAGGGVACLGPSLSPKQAAPFVRRGRSRHLKLDAPPCMVRVVEWFRMTKEKKADARHVSITLCPSISGDGAAAGLHTRAEEKGKDTVTDKRFDEVDLKSWY